MHVTHYTIFLRFFWNARQVRMKLRFRAENRVFRKKSVVLSLRSGGRPRVSCSMAYNAAMQITIAADYSSVLSMIGRRRSNSRIEGASEAMIDCRPWSILWLPQPPPA
jgi:hypothetical protein